MVFLQGKPKNIGGKYWLYRAKLHDEKAELGADSEKIAIKFDYVSDQEVSVDPKKTGRYTVEKFGTKGFFEFVEIEGSDVDVILRRNVDRETPFEFSVKGPFGQMKYLGWGKFYK